MKMVYSHVAQNDGHQSYVLTENLKFILSYLIRSELNLNTLMATFQGNAARSSVTECKGE